MYKAAIKKAKVPYFFYTNMEEKGWYTIDQQHDIHTYEMLESKVARKKEQQIVEATLKMQIGRMPSLQSVEHLVTCNLDEANRRKRWDDLPPSPLWK